jgi:hypothetical protein
MGAAGTNYRCRTMAHFKFMLPYIVIDFFLNNQPGALIIQIYSVMKLYMFGVEGMPETFRVL